jgi:branched-chain amino acid aminotransferase
MPVAERDLPLEVLRTAQEVFITSSTRNVQPVSAIVGGGFDRVLEAPGPLSARAAQIFAERAADDLDP